MKKIIEILKIFNIFNYSEIIILIVLFLITAILEVTGIFSIVPLISILFNEDKVLSNEYTQYIFSKFNFINKDNYLIFSGIFVVLVNIFSNLFNLISQITIHKLCWKNQHKINQMLFDNYFNSTFKNKTLSTAETFRQLSSDVDSLRTGIITTSLTIISKFVSILLIFLFISYLNIKVSFSIFITITLFYIFFYKSIASTIKKNSQIFLNRSTEKIRVMQDMLSAYKQLKVMNLYNNFINHYHYQFNEIKKVDIRSTILSILPRYLLEPIFVFIFIVLFISSKLVNDQNLGFYAAILYSFFRMAPAFQAIYYNYGTIKKYYPIYQNILSKLNFNILDEKKNSNFNFNNFKTVGIRNLTFSYEGNKKIFLNQNITFKIGESYFIEGENGSGKTTLVDILMKIIPLQEGDIFIDDVSLKNDDEKNYQSLFSYTPQKNHIFETTLEKNISLETKNKFIDFDKIEKIIKYFKFEDFLSGSDEIKLKKGLIASNGKNISGGQAQKIGILRSFYFDKKILIFDESTNEIDTNSEKEILNNILMKKKDKLIIFISHNLNLKKYFDNIVSIKHGIIKQT